MSLTLENIAEVCHEANRAYCKVRGDLSHKPWAECSTDLQNSVLRGVMLRVSRPYVTDREMHEAWFHDHLAQGWVYGPVKDPVAKTHPCMRPCMRPYEELPLADRLKDSLFSEIVSVLRRLLAEAPKSFVLPSTDDIKGSGERIKIPVPSEPRCPGGQCGALPSAVTQGLKMPSAAEAAQTAAINSLS